MKKYFCVLLFCVVSSITAKSTPGKNGTISGFVYDADLSQAIEYATISLLNSENDSLLDGTISNQSGFFEIKNVHYGKYTIKISFIGYKSEIIDHVIVNKDSFDCDLGQINLSKMSSELDEVKIVSDRGPVSFKIDRKIIHVDQQDLSLTGTAVDVLQNYPSISVDIDGTVSLRGSTNFTVLIDNKPTSLNPSDMLNQIPASTIKNIELITNPTAKYNAEGTTGIINVILKKDKLQGVTGLIQVNGGMYNNYGGDILINLNRKKTNFYIDLNINNRGIEGKLKNISRSNSMDTLFYITSDGTYDRINRSISARGGADFQLDSNNTISVQGTIGNWWSGGTTKLNYDNYTEPISYYINYNSREEPLREGNFYNLDLKYNHNFRRKGHQLSSLFYFDRRDLVDQTKNKLRDENDQIINAKKSVESGPTDSYNFQLDYTLPLASGLQFEAGYKAELAKYNKQSELYQYDLLMQDFILDSNYWNHVKFNKNIHALYSLFSGSLHKLGYQIGLRAEYTDRSIKQSLSNQINTIQRIDFFPTIHFSFDMNESRQFMLSYTRRIGRPKDWQLEPFYTWRDEYNLRMGNPGLKPEYIDAYEFNFINKWSSNSFSVDVYYHATNNSIETIQQIYDENTYLLTYENTGTNKALGTELMISMDPFKWWRFYLSGNLYNDWLSGEIDNQEFEKQSLNWNARFYNTFNIGEKTRLQLSVIYNSPSLTVQGDNQGYFMTNVSVKKEIFKYFSATIQAQGVLGLLKREKTFKSDNFYMYKYIEPYTPIVSLSISYKIRQFKNNRSQRSLDMDNGEGGL